MKLEELVAKLYRSADASEVEGYPSAGEWKRELVRRFKKAVATLRRDHFERSGHKYPESAHGGYCMVCQIICEIEGSSTK